MIRSVTYSFFAAMVMSAPLTAQADPVIPVCDIVDEQDIYWEAAGETVTLRTELRTGAQPYPDGHFFLIMSDGQEIFVGEGTKFLDDYPPEDVPSCQDHLEAAQRPILDSLEGTSISHWNFEFKTYRDVDAVYAAPCTHDNERGKVSCDNVQQFIEEYALGSDVITQPDVAAKLREQNAPLLAVPYSTYGWNVVAIDRENGEVYHLFYSGC